MNEKHLNLVYINILVILLTIYSFNLPLNSYSIAKKSYQIRLIDNYGFCEKVSYGYIDKINKKFGTTKNIESFNFDNYPKSSSVFFYKINNIFDDKKIIILNYDSNNPLKTIYFQNTFKNYKILDNYKNKCFLLEKI
tara:strand:- start:42 stop:452 length:411 start_codon:yes stop_codon:yes gene_type:complete